MKAIYAYNARGTIHDWCHMGGGSYVAKCGSRSGTEVPGRDLQTSVDEMADMPRCKRCFPDQTGAPQK